MAMGGQSIFSYDWDLAPYVRKSYYKHYKELSEFICDEEELTQRAWEKTDEECYQASESFVHNANSMHSRGGSQTPFVSLNTGTNTSKEGRMLTKNLLLAQLKGLGKGETPVFPIICMRVKEGINLNEGDPNYDLFKLALLTMSKRLFPTFAFIDAPFNLQYYNPNDHETEIAYMG